MGIRQTELSDARILAAVAFCCSVAILAGALVVTLMIGAGGSEALRWPFRIMCHGQLERAFEISGVAMPLCARCCGVYGGMAVAAFGLVLFPPRYRSRLLFIAGAILVIPLVVDGTFQMLGVWSTEDLSRAATGLGFGTGLLLLAGNGIARLRSPSAGDAGGGSGPASRSATASQPSCS